MSGFAAWEQGPYGTITLGLLMLALGIVIGLATGIPVGRRWEIADQAALRAEAKAAAWWRQIRAAERVVIPPGHDPRCTHDHEEDQDWCGQCPACEDMRSHEDQALVLARPETDEEFSARLAASADEIIAWAHAAAGGDDQ